MAPLVGRIDHDEYVRDEASRPIYRIDEIDFYDMEGRHIGEIEAVEKAWMVVSSDQSGVTCHFVIRPEFSE
ncbi:hypothetical protein [Halopseudomonas xiamenensis]|uniref:hypothetical protein n=1 Tax=Halopseudomonas xiamenensis TaxID=157792 RepID=UPI0016257B80|nr:hypothetical protein [Halopseudomonas xiamenensis]